MAAPLIHVEGYGYIYRDKIESFEEPMQSGTLYVVVVNMASGQSHELTFDTEAKANNAIAVLKNETEVDIIED